jgi:hypothetical protein
MAVYLPEKVFAVCTNQMDPAPKQFLISDLREPSSQTVLFGSKSKVFLVKIDKKLTSDFKCKTNWSSGAGMVAMGAGVAVGLGIAAACMTVPVAGWIVGGVLAIGCLAYGLWQMSQRPSCSEMIGFEESQWNLYHTTVRFDSFKVANKDLHLALTKNSMLSCKEGGVLLPFISQSSAISAAENIADSNKTEMWINVGAGFLTGVLLGFSMGMVIPAGGSITLTQGSLHALKQTAIFGGWMVVGHYAVTPIAQGFGTSTNSWIGGNAYKNVKENQISSSSTISPASNWDPLSPRNDIKDIRNRMAQNNASNADLAKFDAAIAEAERQGSYSLKKNPQLQEMINRIKAGEFGPELQERVTNKSGNLRGMINEKNIKNVSNTHSERTNSSIAENNKLNLKGRATSTGGILALIAPFVSNYFAEQAIRLAAEEFASDSTDGITVNACEG